MIGPDEPRPDLTIVVSNNDGGGIFATLEPADKPHRRAFERVFGTPHSADLAALVAGLGHRYSTVDARGALEASLVDQSGIHVVEVRTDRTALREQLGQLRSAVMEALNSAL